MKTRVISTDGAKQKEIELPEVFESAYRPEVIHRAYVNIMSHSYQKQGRYPAAGEMVSAESRNTGLGIARLARARGEGFTRSGQAASVAGVRHGRVAHPPESWKIIYKKINRKESRLALCSAIGATSNRDLVLARGHKIADSVTLPIVVSNDVESISKTKDLKKFLVAAGLEADLERAVANRKSRSGTARRRGRSSQVGKSALIVVGQGARLISMSDSVPGVEVKSASELSVLDLAPGSKPIRLTLFSETAIDQLKNMKTASHRILQVISSGSSR